MTALRHSSTVGGQTTPLVPLLEVKCLAKGLIIIHNDSPDLLLPPHEFKLAVSQPQTEPQCKVCSLKDGGDRHVELRFSYPDASSGSTFGVLCHPDVVTVSQPDCFYLLVASFAVHYLYYNYRLQTYGQN